MPETFSSEIGEPHGLDPRERDSFNTEFRGASDSLIRNDRPKPIGGRGRTGIFLIVLVFAAPLLGFAAFALWYWSEPIGSWIAGLGSPGEPAVETESEGEPEEVAAKLDLPAEPPVEKVFGIKGAPDGSEPAPEPQQPDPPQQPDQQPQPPPDPPPQPDSPGAKIETISTNVRGKVSSSSIHSRLSKVDEALAKCWAGAGAAGPVELVLSFGIKWNGKLQGISLRGGSETLHGCVRQALPTSGWQQPSDGGDASVTRTWKLTK